MNHLLPAALVAVLAFANPTFGQDCSDDPNNLLNDRNCGFSNGVAGWNSIVGAISQNGGDGQPVVGSLQGVSQLDPNGNLMLLTIGTPCVNVSPSTSYGCGGRFKRQNGNVSFCQVTVAEYGGANCGGSPSRTTSSGGEFAGTNWDTDSESLTTGPSTASVSITVSCRATGNFTALVDNLYFGEGLTLPVELQSFSVE